MPDEAAQIIMACEERLLAAHTITAPFTMADIQVGILKEYLIEEDYQVPNKVSLQSKINMQVLASGQYSPGIHNNSSVKRPFWLVLVSS